MDSFQLSKDKYDRTLAIINAIDSSNIDSDSIGLYMAILVVDIHNEGAKENFGQLARKLADNKVFTIAIFVTGQYDWTFDNALLFGINAWFVASSKEEAESVANDIKSMLVSDSQMGLDLADIKTILYKGEGRQAYYATGTSNNLKEAIDNAVQNAKEHGMSIYDCSKFLIAINTPSELQKEQMNDLNDFINRLSEMHSGNFEMKWGLASASDTPLDTLKVTLFASY